MDGKPKLDFKMFILPAVLLLTRKINFKDAETEEAAVREEGARNIWMAQQGLIAVSVLMATIYAYIYSRIGQQKDKTAKIFVPPKPKPTLPFNMGPPPEPEKAEDYEETTYADLEIKLLREALGGLAFNVAMALFMSYKFKVHVSLLMQCLSLPLNAVDSQLIKKYVLGQRKSSSGEGLYLEETERPTNAILLQRAAKKKYSEEELAEKRAVVEQKVKVEKAKAGDDSSRPCLPGEPRVEELPADESSAADKGAKGKSAVNELD